MEPHWYIVIEIFICFIISFILVYFYTRRGTNPLVLITAGVTWGLNFILIVFIPYDLYYTYQVDNNNNNDKEIIYKLLYYGYQIIYWTIFICSWIFIPLMQEYENSGDFTKKKKFIRSIKNNLIFYSISGIFAIIFLIIGFFIKNRNNITKERVNIFINFLYEISNFSYFIGLLLFYFLFAYSIATLPIKIYNKTNYSYQIKYLEWRAIDLIYSLEKIKNELIDDGYLLQSTLEYFQIMKRVNKSKTFEDNEIINDNKEEDEKEYDFTSKILADYSKVIKERYDYLYDNSKVFDINLKRNALDNDKEPLKNVEELIKLNRKINKNEWDDLRIQIRLRSLYKHWITLSTVLYEQRKNQNGEVTLEIESNINTEELIQNENQEQDSQEINIDEKFIPLKDISKYTIFYYNKLRRPFLYIYLSILVLGALLTLITQIGSIFDFSLYGKILEKVINKIGIFGLHFFIMIPIIFLFVMSIYTFFKLKISGYFYMYKNRQTDSVSLLFFSTNLCRISYSICLSFILTTKVAFETKKTTKIEEILGLNETNNSKNEGEESELNILDYFFYIFKYSPLFLGVCVLILILKIPQRIAKLFGKIIFQLESNESMEEIKDGHDYYMEINEKYKGELIPKENLILPADKYNK